MYKKNNMLREKRKHANYKPNRRLDAKSSRGMIYENEELRIRTININAEVERGQSEIKTLKREREQLRREIWTLRDEYDKLENLLRIKGIDPDEFLNQRHPNNNEDDDDENASECSECSCDECCEEDCCDEKPASSENPAGVKEEPSSGDQAKSDATLTPSTSKTETQAVASSSGSKNTADEHNKRSGKDRLNLNFDHLSVVSEENSEGNSIIQNEDSSIPINDLSAFLHNVDVLSPLSYLQKLAPPLAHFENLNYEQAGGSNVDQFGNITSSLPQLAAMPAELPAQQANGSSVMSSSIDRNGKAPLPVDPTKKESRLKHFFSPIRRKNTAPVPVAPPVVPYMAAQPDVFISNILPSNMYVNPISNSQQSVPEITERPHTSTREATSPSFQNGGNLEELLFDLEALSLGLEKHCPSAPIENETTTAKKPFRSELNLILSYPPPSTDEGSSDANSQITPPMPEPMGLITPSFKTNPIFMQNLPSPFPSVPTSPLTPPTSFSTNDANPFDRIEDYANLKFPPINAPIPPFAANTSVFCTVSAPSTPASDRKCIDKFCNSETSNESQRTTDKKKAKRVSIAKEEDSDKGEPPEVNNNDKESESKKAADLNNGNHHSHLHRNHSHGHLHPKRRMSLDNTVNASKHKNHRQICHDPAARLHRHESNRSSNSFKKRSRSDSNFGMHGDEGGTSMSERYSNSLASSRESSTSLSMRSGKRRISITSYGGSKKIPWCGCWGNSCL